MHLESEHEQPHDLNQNGLPPLSVLESVLYVDDLDAAEEFYTEVLGLELYTKDPGRHVFFTLDRESMLLVFDPAETSTRQTYVNGSEIPMHGMTGIGHVALRMNSGDVQMWMDRLAVFGIPIESDVQWPNGGRSLYFRDPAGNSVELATPRLWRFSEDAS
jgi:catechol 2,3-dioxygenase-like lactoylglutathione lyase family enzyme